MEIFTSQIRTAAEQKSELVIMGDANLDANKCHRRLDKLKLFVEAMSQTVLMDKAYVTSVRIFGLRISPH